MDLKIVGPDATEAERPPSTSSDAVGGRAERGVARGMAARGHAARAPRPAAAGAPRRAGANRLDQPGRAQPHLPAPDGARPPSSGGSSPSIICCPRSRARRSSRMSATTSRAASRRRSALRIARAAIGPAGRPEERDGDVDAQPLSGSMRARPGGAATVAGEAPRTITLAPAEDGVAPISPRSRPAGHDGRATTRAGRRLAASSQFGRLRSGNPDSGCSAASAPSTRRASTPIARTAATGRCARAIELGPEGVIREVAASKLLGRGGAAFPTGRKWDAVAKAAARPHYLVCNADESEPGTFKDRLLMEEDPFALVEGMTIAGYATGVRARLPLPARRVPAGRPRGWRSPSPHARAAGFLGDDIMGAGFAFDIEIRRGGGRLHLRRGDGAVQLDRGQARRAAQQAAVSRSRSDSSASPPW